MYGCGSGNWRRRRQPRRHGIISALCHELSVAILAAALYVSGQGQARDDFFGDALKANRAASQGKTFSTTTDSFFYDDASNAEADALRFDLKMGEYASDKDGKSHNFGYRLRRAHYCLLVQKIMPVVNAYAQSHGSSPSPGTAVTFVALRPRGDHGVSITEWKEADGKRLYSISVSTDCYLFPKQQPVFHIDSPA